MKTSITAETKNTGDVFGEGATAFGDHAYQLTYREKKLYKYDIKTLEKTGEYEMPSSL